MMFRLLDIPRIPREDEFLRYQRWLRRHSQDVVDTLMIPEIPANSFAKKLYSTYLSYLPKEKVAFPLKMNVDDRGSFTELVHTLNAGQAYMGNIGSGGDDASTMVWAIFAVFFALSLCLWFVWSYRHRSLTPSV